MTASKTGTIEQTYVRYVPVGIEAGDTESKYVQLRFIPEEIPWTESKDTT